MNCFCGWGWSLGQRARVRRQANEIQGTYNRPSSRGLGSVSLWQFRRSCSAVSARTTRTWCEDRRPRPRGPGDPASLSDDCGSPYLLLLLFS